MKNQHLRKGALPKNDVVPKQPLPSNALSTADVHSDRSATEKHMDNLNDDLLLTILNSLAPSQRQLIASTNKRLNLLCHSTYSSVKVVVPWASCGLRGGIEETGLESGEGGQSSTSGPPVDKFHSVKHLTLQIRLPSTEDVDKGRCVVTDYFEELPRFPLNLWLQKFLEDRNSLRHVVSIRLCGLSTPPASPQLPILGSPALRTLALHCPELRHLALPLVTRGAAPALALLTQLHSLSLTVTDGGALEAVIKLIQLHFLSLTTQKDLFYLILQQSQVEQLAFFPHLSSLHLQNVIIHDGRPTFILLEPLVSLTELRSSYPLTPSHLSYLKGLRVLQLPFFSGSMGDLGGHAQGLTELRIKQGLREPDLLNLSSLSRLRTLVCDSIILSEAPHEDPCIGTGISLPSVRTLRMTGNVCHYGVWADLFPNLEVLEATSAVNPSPHAVPITPFSSLTRLHWPATKLTPSLVSAASSLTHLSLANINSIPRIEEVLHMAAVPLGLRTLVLGFKGCLARFRPRQLQNVMTRSPASMVQVEWLTLKDEAPATTKEYGDCGRIVDDSVILAVIVRFKYLRELRLIGCSAITVEGLEAGVRQAPHRLERIIVAGCPRIPRHSVEHIPGSVNKHWLHVEWRESADHMC